MDEKNMQISMQIILNAGDARAACKKALDAVAKGELDLAKERIKDAQEKITIAHRIQTDAIQAETNGATPVYSLLFSHAQDTLMTVYSELNIARQLIKIFTSYDNRISELEKNMNKLLDEKRG